MSNTKLLDAKIAKLESARATTICNLLANTADDGRFGRAFEVSCARPLSHKTEVSAQNRADVSIKMLVNGKIQYVHAECKTNGGRVNDLLDGSNKSRFIIYRLDTVQKHKATKKSPEWVETRTVKPVVIPTDLFLQMLKECNALKTIAHGGVVDGIGIQVSSKKMYERLTAYVKNYGKAVIFDREHVYEDWDFDGLEL